MIFISQKETTCEILESVQTQVPTYRYLIPIFTY